MNKKELGKKILTELSRILLGVTFIFSGFVKSVDPLGTTYKIEDYLLAFNLDFLFILALPLSIGLCVLEFSLGVFVLLGIYRKWSSRIMLLVMVFMTLLTLYLAIANPVSDCGCFGDAIKITNWQTFYKNLILLAAAVVIFLWYEKISNLYTGKFYWIAGLYILVFGIGFCLYNYYTEPMIDFRPYKTGANLPELINVEEGKGDVYENIFIYEKDGLKKEFSEDNYPWQDTSWIFVDRTSKLIKEGVKPVIQDFDINRLYFDEDGNEVEGEENITQEVLEEEYVFLMIAYSLYDMRETHLDKFEEMQEYAREHNYGFYCLTSSTTDEILRWEKENANNFIYCLTDERTLKTMMRSNPGLMLLKEGVIINKWTGAQMPEISNFPQPLENSPVGQMATAKSHEKKHLINLFVIFLMPLLIIKLLDSIIYRKRKQVINPGKKELI